MNIAPQVFWLRRLFASVPCSAGLRSLGLSLPRPYKCASPSHTNITLSSVERRNRRYLASLIAMLCLMVAPMSVVAVTPMVAAGHAHTVALKSDGTVMTWGSNFYGELGDGTQLKRSSPLPVPSLSGVVAVAAGGEYSVALKSDGTVVEWGVNGNDTNSARLSPVTVAGLTQIVAVSVGEAGHAVALKSDGTVMTWGYNAYGQLGDGTTTTRYSAEAVPGLAGVIAVAAGYGHTVALKADGAIVAWGFNVTGQLGDGTTIDRHSPVAAPGLTGVAAVTAGAYCTIALKADGTAVAFGQCNASLLAGINGLSAIAFGGGDFVALGANGTALAWGDNEFGQFGDGTTISRLNPVGVPGLNSVVEVAAGVRHTVALKGDGTVLAWGWNDYGQLGDGTTTQRLSPVATGLSLGIVTPVASLSRTALSFTTENVGSSSAAQTLSLTNTGSSLLYIPSIFTSGDYARTTTCGAFLAVGANCNISVTFTPTATGVRNGVVAFVANGVIVNSVSLNGTGLGPVVSITSSSLTFGAQNLASTSAAQSVTLSNVGNVALNIASIVAGGDYGVTHNCGTGLGAGGFCTLFVTFSPTATGTRTGTITITDDAFDNPQTIGLSGVGLGGTASLSATVLAFNSQNVGTTSTAKTVTLSNTGGAVLNIASIVANGNFARTTTCSATLAQATSCTISVTFAPTTAGSHISTLVITSDATTTPNTIDLSGTGTPMALVALNPSVVNFAPQTVSTHSAGQTVTLTNTGGATLIFDSIVGSGDFAVTNNCGGGLSSGGVCSLSVVFTPTLEGARNGTLTITSNAMGSPSSLNLTGTGRSPNAPVCTLSAAPPRVRKGGFSILTATCSQTNTPYIWSGGNCAGTTTTSCRDALAVTTTYFVTGTNSSGSDTASAVVTVKPFDLTPILMLLLD